MRVRWCASLLAVFCAFAGCFDDRPASLDAAADVASPDVALPDVALPDVALPDVAPLDAPDDLADAAPDVADVASDDPADAPADVAIEAATRCASDGDCASPTPRCQSATGRCVGCLVGDDCARGQSCDPDGLACVDRCRTDADCLRGAADAGTGGPPARCDAARGRCVECATDDECPLRTICADSLCVPGCDERRGCSVGETCCGNACTDVERDPAHCGACATRCDAPNGVAACATGACAIESCTEGFADCDRALANGCEVNLRADPRNCGRCGTECPDVANAAVACAAGRCGSACRAGYADCDGSGANGCERRVENDPASCGRCGAACPARPGASSVTCAMGACGFTCDAGRADCDGEAVNGCETDTRAAVANCGACGNACQARPHAAAVCAAGACGLRCDAGYGDCDGDASNGCESDLSATAAHCGRCGNRCAVAGGTAACVRGACTIAVCGSDFSDCDGSAANGCETDLRASPTNCGACGSTCPTPPDATPTCEARACGARCRAGFGDCDGRVANGCEVDLRAMPSNCGACGRVCAVANGAAGCAAGACAVAACNAGFADCDGNAANGCEANLARDAANCGACRTRGVEACDGVDNTCDGRVDEGCPAGLTGVDGYDFTSAMYGSALGTSYDLACPAGTYARGVSGHLYSGAFQSQMSFRCAAPRLVEDRARAPFRYSVAWDDAGTAGPVASAAGTPYTFDCPANSVLHRVSGYYYPLFRTPYLSQLTFECASWTVDGSAAAGWHLTRTVVRSASFGGTTGTRFDYACPSEGANSAALRSMFGRYSGAYLSSAGFRCTAPSVAVR